MRPRAPTSGAARPKPLKFSKDVAFNELLAREPARAPAQSSLMGDAPRAWAISRNIRALQDRRAKSLFTQPLRRPPRGSLSSAVARPMRPISRKVNVRDRRAQMCNRFAFSRSSSAKVESRWRQSIFRSPRAEACVAGSCPTERRRQPAKAETDPAASPPSHRR
jgi:hypothetical protein